VTTNLQSGSYYLRVMTNKIREYCNDYGEQTKWQDEWMSAKINFATNNSF